MRRFESSLSPTGRSTVVDVGGTPYNWQYLASKPTIVLLNVAAVCMDPPDARFTQVVGDGCRMGFRDDSFDISFSNSVIEHVGTWENQVAFAREVRRVGRGVWVQTPAWGFPIEPHFLAPFVHWLPPWIRRKVLRYFTPWGLICKPTQERVDEIVREIRLLGHAEMKALFPDCEILVERFLLFPKAYIAVRRQPVTGP